MRDSRIRPTRRRFAALASAAAAAPVWLRAGQAAPEAGWDRAAGIVARIRAPRFPERDFDVTKFGARGDGARDCTEAFAAAVRACHEAGGGRVVAPKGEWLTGPIHLLSRVNLHLEEGATLRFFPDPKRYLPVVPTLWEGMECRNYSALIYALDQQDIAVTGAGVLDGQADCQHWWPWKGRTDCGWSKGEPHQGPARERLMKMVEAGTPPAERIFGEGSYLRPNFLQFFRCRNVLVEGVTIRNSPMWEIHPVLCANVTVRGVKVISHGPNNDGCDPECSRDVLIEDCLFDTGDDCIAIKSGRNADGRRLATPSENIVIRNCVMKDGHGGVTIGSEISGGARHIYAERCRMDSPNLDRVLRLKTNAMRGGVIEHVSMRDIEVGTVADALLHIDFFYEEGANGPHLPTVRQIEMENIRCRRTKYGVYIRGFEKSPVRDLVLRNWQVDEAPGGNVVQHAEGIRAERLLFGGRPAAL
ncbi:MAG: glycoside hydrolase family 28 protein [Bryobacteraceae bacterium]|nr:glycoside hydrolase family 28 protein [Bryobacteraceae bacterium]